EEKRVREDEDSESPSTSGCEEEKTEDSNGCEEQKTEDSNSCKEQKTEDSNGCEEETPKAACVLEELRMQNCKLREIRDGTRERWEIGSEALRPHRAAATCRWECEFVSCETARSRGVVRRELGF
ncbi:hypothetical protein Dimus_036381, partial [Dionaea muscipula]